MNNPLVSIGLPVYNGEPFIEDAINSILSQSFRDFELIISDNASEDKTAQICQDLTSKHNNVIYHRNDSNIGAAANFNLVFAMSKGKYFKWVAADAKLGREMLDQCVPILERHDDIILVSTKFKTITREGSIRFVDREYALLDETPYDRLKRLLPICVLPIWGLMRRSVLAETHLIEPFVGSDFCLVMHLATKGKFAQIPEYLMYTQTPESSYTGRIQKSRYFIEQQREAKWFDPNFRGRFVTARWNCLLRLAGLVRQERLPIPQKLSLYAFLVLKLMPSWRRRLAWELVVASGLAPVFLPVIQLWRGHHGPAG